MRLLLASLFIACASCTFTDQSDPWWHEIHRGGDEVLDAVFSSDETTVTVLYRTGVSEVHVGRIKVGASTRAIEDLGVLTVEGAKRNFTVGPDHIDLAARPGTDEVWAYLGEQVAQLNTGTNTGTLVTEASGIVTCCSRGSIAFLDKDTLVFGNDAGVWTFTISGSTLTSPKVIIESAAAFGNERQVGAVDDQIWAIGKAGTIAFKRDGTQLPFGEGQFFPVPMAVAPSASLWSNTSSAIGFCVVPRHPNGGAQWPDSKAGKLDAGGCDNLDIPMDLGEFRFRRADLGRSGKKLTLVFGAFVVVAEEGRPAPASDDLEGVWCGVTGPSFSNTGGTLKTLVPSTAIDDQFKRIVLSGSGQVRTVSLLEPSDAIKENVVRSTYDYFMKRTGNWLVIQGPATEEQLKRHRGAAYLNRSGIFFRGTDETCQTAAP